MFQIPFSSSVWSRLTQIVVRRLVGLAHDHDFWDHQHLLHATLGWMVSQRFVFSSLSLSLSLDDASDTPPSVLSLSLPLDLQHTALGLLWWAGGALGVFISWTGKRNFVPAMVYVLSSFSSSPFSPRRRLTSRFALGSSRFIMTGYAFGGHVQKMMISSMVHKILGSVSSRSSLSFVPSVHSDAPTVFVWSAVTLWAQQASSELLRSSLF